MKKIILILFLFVTIGNCYSQETLSTTSDASILVGCWWMPHMATIHIHFKNDGTFLFHDDSEDLKGKYYLNKGVISLSYNDRAAQSFYLFYYFIDSVQKFEIYSYNKEYHFIKDEDSKNGDCKW